MRSVYVVADNIISPLGFTTGENVDGLKRGVTGITRIDDPQVAPGPVYAARIATEEIERRSSDVAPAAHLTRLEKLMVLSIRDAIRRSGTDVRAERTLVLLSTTKGNIDLLDAPEHHQDPGRVQLWRLAEVIQQEFGMPRPPMVVSQACISGVLAISAAARALQSGAYDQAVVCGGDILSRFVVSGFQSLQSLHDGPCTPFDAGRKGLSLGEACGTMVLSLDRTRGPENPPVMFMGGATSNDANHISGPSRTGAGLLSALQRVMAEAAEQGVASFDYLSTHGTGTVYNDESEACAIFRAGLAHVPANSLKGYWGHTLGAAGVIECVAAVHALRQNVLFRSPGYEHPGVTNELNIITATTSRELVHCLKTASGFGGCNAVAAFSKAV